MNSISSTTISSTTAPNLDSPNTSTTSTQSQSKECLPNIVENNRKTNVHQLISRFENLKTTSKKNLTSKITLNPKDFISINKRRDRLEKNIKNNSGDKNTTPNLTFQEQIKTLKNKYLNTDSRPEKLNILLNILTVYTENDNASSPAVNEAERKEIKRDIHTSCFRPITNGITTENEREVLQKEYEDLFSKRNHKINNNPETGFAYEYLAIKIGANTNHIHTQ